MPCNPALAVDVIGLAAIAQRRDRGQVDDAAPVALDHLALRGARAQKRAPQMHRGDRVPILVGHLVDQIVAGDAGIVDEDVERAEPLGDLLDHRLDLGGYRDIGLEADRRDAMPSGDRSAVASAPAPSRSAIAIAAPSSASRSAVASPMPRAPPVTSATRPSDRLAIILYTFRQVCPAASLLAGIAPAPAVATSMAAVIRAQSLSLRLFQPRAARALASPPGPRLVQEK